MPNIHSTSKTPIVITPSHFALPINMRLDIMQSQYYSRSINSITEFPDTDYVKISVDDVAIILFLVC